MTSTDDLAVAVTRLDRREEWSVKSTLAVRGDVGHPQGLVPWGDGWLVTTVHLDPVRGEVMVVAADGTVVERVELTDGPRIHPGGATLRADSCVVAVAEYRPDSTTLLRRVDTALAVTDIGRIDDHLGAVSELDDGTFFAVSWGSRRFYRLDADGRLLEQRANPSLFVDHQDLTPAGPSTVVATGVGSVPAPAGAVQLGGFSVIDVDDLSVAHSGPVHAWVPSGRVATYNGAHLDTGPGGVALNCIVDDIEASIVRWTA